MTFKRSEVTTHDLEPIQLVVSATIRQRLVEGAMVVVNWSASSPSTPTIPVRIQLKHSVFSVILCLKSTKINKKRPGLVHYLKKDLQKVKKFCLIRGLKKLALGISGQSYKASTLVNYDS